MTVLIRVARTPASYVLGGVLVLSLSVAATPAQAETAWTPVAIENAQFALPAVPAGQSNTNTPTGWYQSTPNPFRLQMFSPTLARHPQNLQAVSLNNNGPGKLRQRLWNVNAGSHVRVRFSDSASTLASCTPGEVAAGQKYRVTAYKETAYEANGEPAKVGNTSEIARTVHATQDYTTLGYSKTGTTTPGSGAWSDAPKVFEFTAAEDNPLIIFESLEENAPADTSCGPLIADVSAEEQAVAINHDIEQNKMPFSAFNGVDEISMATASNTCKASPSACRFTADPRYTYQYFLANRILGEAYLNCTRNQITDRRTVTWTEEGFDSISQELNRVKNAHSVDQNAANTGADDPNMQTTAVNLGGNPNMFQQAAAGFQRNEGNPNLVNTTNPFLGARTTTKVVDPPVQPGEASWIEVQASRERVEGLFRSTAANTAITIEASFDFPSGKVPDRLYERSGPLTQDEKKHCLTERPLKVTPDNGGTRSLMRSGDAGNHLVRTPVSPSGRETKTAPVTAAKP
ncbi:hypothetical protein [Streptomyces erythrochromogenes]|uniref:hypothetical protein n=1 Tax=Streptomyces erythrochromogenes TaxID=285574 RepID=UPI003866E3AD|nr:hypothetical protein OG489_34010 [Streptomyces erythrochromogenes]